MTVLEEYRRCVIMQQLEQNPVETKSRVVLLVAADATDATDAAKGNANNVETA